MKQRLPKYVCEYLEKKGLPLDVALTFEDVTIVDRFSRIPSRSNKYIDTSVNFGKGVILPRPIFSANMDTITESAMAIALARFGGCGVITQALTEEKKIVEIGKVKRADSHVIESPITVKRTEKIKNVRDISRIYNITSFIVVEKNGKSVAGTLSKRDIRWAPDDLCVEERMTPITKLIRAPQNITLEEAKKILYETRMEKLPLIDENGEIAGLITADDIIKREQYKFAFRDKKGRLGVAAAVGIGQSMLSEIEALLKAEADIIVLDTARGNSLLLQKAVKESRRVFGEKFLLVAGNIDTPDGMKMLYDAGTDVPKEGIGGGSKCKTRKTAGVGISKITSSAGCGAVAEKYKMKFISDGGIKGPDDYCKSLIVAHAVMIGGLFGATDETPGPVIYEGGERWKFVRGSASTEFQMDRVDRPTDDNRMRAPEGILTRERCRGPVTPILEELNAYHLSAMSYVGAKNMKEYHARGYFFRQTGSGYEEGKPHDVF